MEVNVWEQAKQGIMGFNYDILRQISTLPTDSWEGSVQHSFLNSPLIEVPSPLPASFAPFNRAAAVMMIKDEADIIEVNLNWLYHIGIRKFIVTDNDSTDDSADLINSFRMKKTDVEFIYILDPIVRHIQAEFMTSMHQMARNIWPDITWIFLLDADEFLIPNNGLHVLDLLKPEITGLTIQRCVHQINGSFSENYGADFKRMNLRSHLFSHSPKVAVRSIKGIVVGRGNHRAHYERDHKNDLCYAGGTELGFYIREFPVRSFAHFKKKSLIGARAVLEAEKVGLNVGGTHWKTWAGIFQEQGEDGLFEYFKKRMLRYPGDGFIEDPFDPLSSISSQSEVDSANT